MGKEAKTLVLILMKMDDRYERLPRRMLPNAVCHALSKYAAVRCTRFSEDGNLHIQFFSHEAAKAIKEMYEDDKLPLKFDWSFVNLDIYWRCPPNKVTVVHVDEAERERDRIALEEFLRQDQHPTPDSSVNPILPLQSPDRQPPAPQENPPDSVCVVQVDGGMEGGTTAPEKDQHPTPDSSVNPSLPVQSPDRQLRAPQDLCLGNTQDRVSVVQVGVGREGGTTAMEKDDQDLVPDSSSSQLIPSQSPDMQSCQKI